jgi:hypothetical protein
MLLKATGIRIPFFQCETNLLNFLASLWGWQIKEEQFPRTTHFCKVNQYDYRNSVHYPSSCLLFKTQLKLNSTQPNPTQPNPTITSPLRSEQINVIYRFVTTIY